MLDESRRILMSLLEQKWYQKLEDGNRVLSEIYPWFALWCAYLRVNPFENKQGREDASKFAFDQVKVVASILVEMEKELPENDIIKDF